MQPHSLYKGIKQLAHTTGSLIIVNKEHTNTIRQKPIIMRGQSSQSRKRHLNSNFWFMCRHGEPDALHATGNLNQWISCCFTVDLLGLFGNLLLVAGEFLGLLLNPWGALPRLGGFSLAGRWRRQPWFYLMWYRERNRRVFNGNRNVHWLHKKEHQDSSWITRIFAISILMWLTVQIVCILVVYNLV